MDDVWTRTDKLRTEEVTDEEKIVQEVLELFPLLLPMKARPTHTPQSEEWTPYEEGIA